MASNLPPGCRESDIPGNRPEDIAHEKLVDEIESALKPLPALTAYFRDEQIEQTIDNIIKLINDAREEGYKQCESDEAERQYVMSDAYRHEMEDTPSDTPKFCPECEKPNQFGELCESCRRATEQ
jgi:hypothetical protein